MASAGLAAAPVDLTGGPGWFHGLNERFRRIGGGVGRGLRQFIKQFPKRVTTDGPATEYYAILKELGKLKRNELRVFKTRFRLSMEKCRSGEFACRTAWLVSARIAASFSYP